MNVESRLAELIGPAAGRLHTARSRNDQVATDFRLCVRDAIDALDAALAGAAAGAGREGAEACRHRDAGLHPSADGAARSPSAIICSPMSRCSARDRGRFADARRAQRIAARRGGARRHLVPDRPRRRPRRSASTGRSANSLDAVSDRDFVLESAGGGRRSRRASVALRRGDRDLVLAAIRLRAAVRPLHDRLLDHAAEAQPRRGRAGARQGRAHHRRAHGAADRDEGPAARLSEGHAGGQGRRLRCASPRCRWRSPR